MSGLGFFAGAAAEKLGDSTLEWRRLWGMEKEADRNYDLAQQQMKFTADQNTTRMAFDERLAAANRDWQDGVLEQTQAFDLGKIAINEIGSMGIDEQAALVANFTEMGNPFSSLLSSKMRQGFFTTPDQAYSVIDRVFNSPPGQRPDAAMVGMALDAFIGLTGMGADEAEAYRESVMDLVGQRVEDADTADTEVIDQLKLATSQARANVAVTEAQPNLVNAQAAQVWQNVAVTDEQRAVNLEILGRQASLLELDEVKQALLNTQLDTQNQYLPELLQAEVRQAWANVANSEDAHTLFIETLDFQIKAASLATGIQEEELRHLYATSAARDAVVNKQPDQLEAIIASTWAQEANTEANTAYIGIQGDALGLSMEQTRIQIASDLVASGNPALFAEMAPELLRGLVSEEGMARVTGDMVSIAASNLSNRQKTDAANATLAAAEAEYAEWRVLEAPVQARFDRMVASENLTLNRRQVNLAEDRLAHDVYIDEWGMRIEENKAEAYITSLQAQAGTTGGAARPASEVHQAIRLGGMISVSDLTESNGAVARYATDADILTRASATLGNPSSSAQAVATANADITALAQRYEVDMTAMEPAEAGQLIASLVERDRAVARSLAVSQAATYARAWMGETGELPSAEDLGFPAADTVFLDAIATIPGFSQVEPGVSGVEASVRASVADAVINMGEGGIMPVEARAVYDMLERQYGAETLALAGYNDPGSILPLMNSTNEDFTAMNGRASAAAQLVAQVAGLESLDVSEPWARAYAEQGITAQVASVTSLLEAASSLPSRGSQFGEISEGGITNVTDMRLAEANFLSSLTAALQLTPEQLQEMGLASPRMDWLGQDSGTLQVNRQAMRSFLTERLGVLAEGQTALITIEGVETVRAYSQPPSTE